MLPSPKRRAVRKFLYAILGIVVLLLSCAFFADMIVPSRSHVEVDGQNDAMRAQVDNLEARVKALETRVTADAAAAKPMPQPDAAPPSAPPPQPDTASAEELARVKNEMIAMSSALAAVQADIKATGASADQARQTAQSLIASAVAYLQARSEADAGHAFADNLALLRDAATNDAVIQTAVAQLEPQAATGVPTLTALREELVQRRPAVAVAVAKGSAQNWWDRVKAEFQGLISVRPLHGGEQDTLTQLDSALTQSSAKAEEAFQQLPADAKRDLADWHARLEARLHIDENFAAIAARLTNHNTVKTP
jgi:hypothetical protein